MFTSTPFFLSDVWALFGHLFCFNGSNEGAQAGLPGTRADFLGGLGVPMPLPGWMARSVSLAH